MKNESLEYKKILSKIKNKNIILFCGAGASQDSGIPTVKNTYTYLSKLFAEIEDQDYLEDCLNSSKLPFERIMQTMIESSGNDSFLELYEEGRPNINHIFAASLAKAKKLTRIITTNFDQLFERALLEEGLKENIDFKVYSLESDFADAILENGKYIQIIKLHGTIKNDKISRESIRITIKSIAERLLNEKRQAIIEDTFLGSSRTAIIFLGYSFSDKFDITPHIQSIKKIIRRPIYIINHSEEEMINISNQLNAFQAFQKKSLNGAVINSKTKIIIRDLFFILLNQKKNESFFQETKINWELYFDKWIRISNRKFLRWYIASKLFDLFDNFKLMLKYARLMNARIIEVRGREWKQRIAIQFAFSVFKNANSLSEEKKSLQLFNKILQSLLKINKIPEENKQKLISIVLFQKGRILEMGEKWSAALKLYCMSYKIDYKLMDKLSMSIDLHQIAYIIQKFKRDKIQFVFRLQEKSIKLKRDVGYLNGVALSCHELGNSYFIEGLYEAALEQYEIAEKFAEDIGELSLIPKIKTMKGLIYSRLGRFENAVLSLESAYNLKKAKADESFAITCFNFSEALFGNGDIEKSISILFEAKTIYRSLNRKVKILDCVTQELYFFRFFTTGLITEKSIDEEVEEIFIFLNSMPIFEKAYFLFELANYTLHVKKNKIIAKKYIDQAQSYFKDFHFERRQELDQLANSLH